MRTCAMRAKRNRNTIARNNEPKAHYIGLTDCKWQM